MIERTLTTSDGVNIRIEYKEVENPRVVINGEVQPTTYSNKLVVTAQDVEIRVAVDYCDESWLDIELQNTEGDVEYLSTQEFDF